MACVNLPAFPLQLLVRHHPDWKHLPAAVVDKDTPRGVILRVNSRSARRGILPGMRYAKGLSLSSDLRAGVIATAEVEAHVDALTERLRFFTPGVEASHKAPGVFWLDASGLSLLYPSIKKWAGLIGSELSRDGYRWTVAVGFSRYGTYAAARTCKKIVVFDDPEEERRHARSVAVVRLGFNPELRCALAQLGITTLGGFMDLPADGIRKRFGSEAHALYKLAKDDLYTPIDSHPPREPFTAGTTLDHPAGEVPRLLPVIDTLLQSILTSLAETNGRIAALTLSLTLDNGEKRNEHLRPASPTVDAARLLKLIELRLQSISLRSGVIDITVDVEATPAAHKQLHLFEKKPKRDLEAAGRAFARLRAEFGEHAVMKATLRDGHLPEARYEWEPMEKLLPPSPRKIPARSLVRRIFSKSIELLSWPRPAAGGRPSFGNRPRPSFATNEPPGGRLPFADYSAGRPGHAGVIGPYVVSGGWWRRKVHREYYYVRNAHGRWLWVYYDRRRKRTLVQGEVG